MIYIGILFIFVAGTVMLARSTLFWLYYVQTKHYRLDRLWLEIKSWRFWQLILSLHRLIIFTLLLLSIGMIFLGIPIWSLIAIELQVSDIIFDRVINGGFLIAWAITALYLFSECLRTLRMFFRHILQIPKFTPKVIALLIIVLLPEIALVYIFSLAGFLGPPGIFLVELFQPFIVLGIFALAYTPNIFLHRYFISRAKKKIAAHKNLTVIGITGSYGKTTTKEFLAHILSKKFMVLKTPAHINVDTGVARVILTQLRSEHEVFIVEMGAYKKGEIKKICDLVRPQYAILTGLSDQHLELFGSLEAIAQAKFELVDAVKDPSHIVANADSEPLVSEFKKRGTEPIWFCGKPKLSEKIFGVAGASNLAGAIAMARILGMDTREIDEAIKDLPQVPHTMDVKKGINGALLIDDTYNANTQGVLTALNDLARAGRSKKIVLFGEVIELGERAEVDHVQIAHAIAKTTDYALLLPSRQRKLMCDTLMSAGYDESHILSVADRDRLKEMIDADTVVLFEGREAAKIMQFLISNS